MFRGRKETGGTREKVLVSRGWRSGRTKLRMDRESRDDTVVTGPSRGPRGPPHFSEPKGFGDMEGTRCT